jgi:spoIIIJ-associated protein
MTKNITELIKKTAQKILNLLEIEATPKIKIEDNNIYYLNIKTPDPGVLIGYHGENLYSLQLILSLIIYKKTGSWQKILVDVGEYRQKRTEALKKIALNAAQKVKFTDESLALPYLNSAERRIVHLTLADHPEVTTESQGEGPSRRVIVKIKE